MLLQTPFFPSSYPCSTWSWRSDCSFGPKLIKEECIWHFSGRKMGFQVLIGKIWGEKDPSVFCLLNMCAHYVEDIGSVILVTVVVCPLNKNWLKIVNGLGKNYVGIFSFLLRPVYFFLFNKMVIKYIMTLGAIQGWKRNSVKGQRRRKTEEVSGRWGGRWGGRRGREGGRDRGREGRKTEEEEGKESLRTEVGVLLPVRMDSLGHHRTRGLEHKSVLGSKEKAHE